MLPAWLWSHIVFVAVSPQECSQGPRFLSEMKLVPAPPETPLEGHPLPSLDFWMQGHAQIERQLVEKR